MKEGEKKLRKYFFLFSSLSLSHVHALTHTHAHVWAQAHIHLNVLQATEQLTCSSNYYI